MDTAENTNKTTTFRCGGRTFEAVPSGHPWAKRFCKLDGDGLVEDLSVRPGECAPCFDGHYRYA
jgi:hypothetical protein